VNEKRLKDVKTSRNITIDKCTHRRIKKGTGMHLVTGRNTEKKTSRKTQKKGGRHRQEVKSFAVRVLK
jgi:hypothetical protein